MTREVSARNGERDNSFQQVKYVCTPIKPYMIFSSEIPLALFHSFLLAFLLFQRSLYLLNRFYTVLYYQYTNISLYYRVWV